MKHTYLPTPPMFSRAANKAKEGQFLTPRCAALQLDNGTRSGEKHRTQRKELPDQRAELPDQPAPPCLHRRHDHFLASHVCFGNPPLPLAPSTPSMTPTNHRLTTPSTPDILRHGSLRGARRHPIQEPLLGCPGHGVSVHLYRGHRRHVRERRVGCNSRQIRKGEGVVFVSDRRAGEEGASS